MTSAGSSPHLGVVAVGRPTFDLELASTMTSEAVGVLGGIDPYVVGSAAPLTDPDEIGPTIDAWPARPDLVVVLQGTFTDARFIEAVATAVPDADLMLWSFPEPRTGDRLRLNSLCGVNLASYRMARTDRIGRWAHLDPYREDAPDRIAGVISAEPAERPPIPPPEAATAFPETTQTIARDIVVRLGRARLGLVGDPPAGFDPCLVDDELLTVLGVEPCRIPLDELFERADRADDDQLDDLAERTAASVRALDEIDVTEIEPSLRMAAGLGALATDRRLDAVAARCWPECFERGAGALCTPLALLAEGGRPGGCEADALGTVTMLLLQWLTAEPAFLADLVDVDTADDTAVLWHCGVAPWSMAAPTGPPRASRHPNREVALTHEFALRPGEVTIARVSASRRHLRMAIGHGRVLDRPLAYRGTGGVVQFDTPVDHVLATVIDEGLEHHYCLGYGDHRLALRAIAATLGMPVVAL